MTYEDKVICDGCLQEISKGRYSESQIRTGQGLLRFSDGITEGAPYSGWHFHNYSCLVKWLVEKRGRWLEEKKGIVSFPTSFGRVAFKKRVRKNERRKR
jgi:hypothetical protein